MENGYADLAKIKTDPDLTAVRERPEFKILLAELEEK